MLVLIGIALIIAGFLLRFNPLLVIMASALATGLAAGLDLTAIIAAFGKAFNDTRYVSIIWIVLPVIGLLEAFGLQQYARSLIGRVSRGALAGLLTGYLLLRQGFAALGLTSVAGHAQTVRPLVAPMAVAAAEQQNPALTDDQREKVKAFAAATDNVGLFFGEDIFLAFGSILLMKGILEGYGYAVEPLQLSLWAIPTAIAAFLIHGFRLRRLDRRMRAYRGQRPVITLGFVYGLAGLIFAFLAMLGLDDRSNPKRFGNAAFWGLLAVSMILGDYLGDFGNGLLVLALVAIAGTGQIGRSPAGEIPASVQAERAARYGPFLLLVALIIPAVALAGTFLFKWVPGLADPKQATLISLAFGVLIALGVAMARLRPDPLLPLEQGRRLLDSVGWAAILPQMLASLGAVFALAGVGEVVGGLIGGAIPQGSLFAAVLAFGLGMALFTMIMGNAFAAFPVMLAAVGMPLLIKQYGGDPAIIASIGMLAGFCGTLMTPMAANFNLVPAALLELKNPYGVIRAQIATALPLLVVNIAFIYLLAFR